MKDKLIELGFKEWSTKKEYCAFFQKRIKNKNVCDLNDKLFLNVYYNDLKNQFNTIDINNTLTLEITLEKNNQWYNFQCYGINESEFLNELEKQTELLIKSVNAISEL